MKKSLAFAVGLVAAFSIAAYRPPSSGAVVFYGDSHIARWDLEHYFPGKHFVNRGISGTNGRMLLPRYFSQVSTLRPSVVVLMFGTNDVYAKHSLFEIETELRAFHLLAERDHARLVVCSLPIATKYPEMTQETKDFNKWLNAYASRNGIPMIDFTASSGLVDGVHLTDASYASVSSRTHI